jgi:tetratricopeptide (TPR) repeat protein
MRYLFFALSLISISCSSQDKIKQDPGKSFEYYRQAMELKENLPARRDSQARRNALQKIVGLLQLSHQYDTTMPIPVDKLIIYSYDMGNYDSSIFWTNKSRRFIKKSFDVAFINSHLGLCYLMKGEMDSATNNFDRALAYKETDTLALRSAIPYYQPATTIAEIESEINNLLLEQDSPLKQNLIQKGLDPCKYAQYFTGYIIRKDSTFRINDKILKALKNCGENLNTTWLPR